MSEWKKLIVSGSNAILSSITTPQGVINIMTSSFAMTSQNTLAVVGSVNYIPKFTSNNTIGNSNILDNGTNTIVNNVLKLNNVNNSSGNIITRDNNGNINYRTPQEILVDAGGVNDMGIFQQITPSLTWTIEHNKGVTHPIVIVYDNNNEIMIPKSIKATNSNTVVITFAEEVNGFVTIGGGTFNIATETQTLISSLIFG
jgi:hypothetical protein